MPERPASKCSEIRAEMKMPVKIGALLLVAAIFFVSCCGNKKEIEQNEDLLANAETLISGASSWSDVEEAQTFLSQVTDTEETWEHKTRTEKAVEVRTHELYLADGTEQVNRERWQEAIDTLSQIPSESASYSVANEQVQLARTGLAKAHYDKGVRLKADSKLDEALVELQAAGDYEDAKDLIDEIQEQQRNEKYDHGISLYKRKKYEEATATFQELGYYKESKSYLDKIAAEKEKRKKKHDTCITNCEAEFQRCAVNCDRRWGEFSDKALDCAIFQCPSDEPCKERCQINFGS